MGYHVVLIRIDIFVAVLFGVKELSPFVSYLYLLLGLAIWSNMPIFSRPFLLFVRIVAYFRLDILTLYPNGYIILLLYPFGYWRFYETFCLLCL